MIINSDSRFWVVTNPNQYSILEDICFETDLKGLENQIIGAERGGYRMTDHGMTIHTVELSARQDAEARLKARG